MSFRFLHSADWHVGKPFASIEDADKRARTRLARIEVIDRLGAAARAGGAQAILVAGDLFDSVQPTRADVTALCGKIGELGLPVHAIPGNHDHAGPGSVWEQAWFQETRRELAPNFHIHLDPEPVAMEGGAMLFPCPLRRRHANEDPTAWLRDPEVLAAAGESPRIVLAHGSVQGFASLPDDEDPRAHQVNRMHLEWLPEPAMDYLGLGDWHGLKMAAPKAWYAGTPETDRFAKGLDYLPAHALMVTARRGLAPVVEPVPTGALHWQILEFAFAGPDPMSRFEEMLDAALAGRVGQDHLKLVLTGQLGLDGMARLDNRLDALRARLLRLKLDHAVTVAPESGELEDMAGIASDPLIAAVVNRLFQESTGPDGEVARMALMELHAALRNTAS